MTKFKSIASVISVVMFISITSFAQNAKLDLSALDKYDSKAAENVNLAFEGATLNAFFEKSKSVNPKDFEVDKADFKKLIEGLKGVYVRHVEFKNENEYSTADIDKILDQVKRNEWSNVVKVEDKKDREIVDISLMQSGDSIIGLAIVVYEPKEFTVVNIVGTIDPTLFNKLKSKIKINNVSIDKLSMNN